MAATALGALLGSAFAVPAAAAVSGTPDSLLAAATSPTISGVVFDDVDRDRLRDASEPGVGGVQIQLRDDAGNLVAVTSTAPNGVYSFGNLVPGRYTVIETANAVDFTDDTTSNVAVIDANGPINGVNFGDAKTSVDAADPGELRVQVWLDANRNGVVDASEVGRVAGAPVRVADQYGNNLATLFTGADGVASWTAPVGGGATEVSVNVAVSLPGSLSATTTLTTAATVAAGEVHQVNVGAADPTAPAPLAPPPGTTTPTTTPGTNTPGLNTPGTTSPGTSVPTSGADPQTGTPPPTSPDTAPPNGQLTASPSPAGDPVSRPIAASPSSVALPLSQFTAIEATLAALGLPLSRLFVPEAGSAADAATSDGSVSASTGSRTLASTGRDPRRALSASVAFLLGGVGFVGAGWWIRRRLQPAIVGAEWPRGGSPT